ncbi:MAG: PD40 domain-containing protein [Deltaproteobacteria bacterium]|nr:PD40 domain-containing protein [Deltaproteobacteria bacterium]
MRAQLLVVPIFVAACSAGADPSGRDAAVADRAVMDVGAAPDVAPAADAGDDCDADRECNDHVACTVDHCAAGVCTHEPCEGCCGDGLACRVGSGCVRAPRICTRDDDCDDEVDCTLDSCVDETSCENQPQSELCPPGQICTTAGCTERPPPCVTDDDCRTANRCLRFHCEPEFGCQLDGVIDCDDGDACTTDECDGSDGCANVLVDADGDGDVPIECGGHDCDDHDRTRHGSAPERCENAVDDDCDGDINEGCCDTGAMCMTACGSTGQLTLDGMECPCLPPAEACNDRDDDCDGDVDEGFDCRAAETRPCMSACGTMGMQRCEDCAWTDCTPPEETCNGADDDCDATADEDFACVAGMTSTCMTSCGSTGTTTCSPSCTAGACTPPMESCNGRDDDCDGTCDNGAMCCSGATADCASMGFASGTATCAADCTWNTTACETCGNGRIDAFEECDGSALGGATCESRGFGGGMIACRPDCTLDTTRCTRCGPWGTLRPVAELDTSEQEASSVVRADGLEIHYGHREGTSNWVVRRASRATPDVSFAGISQALGDNLVPTGLSGDGLVLYLDNNAGIVGSIDLYVATRADTASPFGPAMLLGGSPPGLSTDGIDERARLSPDGLVVYWGSDRPGGMGGTDIWRARRATPAGSFGSIEHVPELSSPAPDCCVTFSADARTVLFSSQRGARGMEILQADAAGPLGPFGTPALVAELNSDGNDRDPWLSSDGQTVYFTSDRAGGAGAQDLWMATRTCRSP